MKDNTKFPLIYLEWVDAFSWSEWMGLEDALMCADEEDCTVREVGWLLRETPHYLFIATAWLSNGVFSGFTKIPKTWVRKRVVLKIGGK